MGPILALLLALSSPIDPKVKLESRPAQPGSNAWNAVQFNDYSFTSMNNIQATEKRTRAILDIFGQAARILAKEDPNGTICTMRTFYKDQKGTYVPRLYISERPQGTATTGVETVEHQLTTWTEKAMKLNLDLTGIPNGVPAPVYLGYLKNLVTTAMAKKASEDVAATHTEDTPPVTDESGPSMD